MNARLLAGAGACALAAALPLPASSLAAAAETIPAEVVVTGQRAPADLVNAPSPTDGVDAREIAVTVSAVNAEDALRYLPDILVRKRHPGDVQDPITTRTSGVGSSARSLIYADGVLLSALIGNNNSGASPRFGMVTPEEIVRVDVLYGPFAAAYPGNSIGAVVNFTTRMPDHLEASLKTTGSLQSFDKYGTKDTYPVGEIAGVLGDRIGPWSFWLSENHSDSRGQPLTFATATQPAANSAAGTPVTGAYTDANRLGQPIVVMGGSGFEHQAQDNAKLKLAYDFTGGITATYVLGYFGQEDDSSVQTYLSNAAGTPVYAGAVNINGKAYTLANSAFDNGVYHLQENHIAQSLTVRSAANPLFSWEVVGSVYDYLTDTQRSPSTALPGGFAGNTAGTISRLDGTGWQTLDARAAWKPFGAGSAHALTFGAHEDEFVFKNPKYATAAWDDGSPTALTSLARGKTQTTALWGQDAIALEPAVTATLGLRAEHWRAFSGYNFSAAPALAVNQPGLSKDVLSPKASLAWTPAPLWRLSASYGRAYRFPTVTELYQSITTGPTLTVPNPNLKPERADSFDLSAERSIGGGGHARLSLFQENLANDLLSQTAPLVAGSSTLYSYVQNIDRVRTRGAEIVFDGIAVVPGVEVGGSLTYADARILSDAAFPTADGKRLPQLPRLRATGVVTWRPAPAWSATLAGRYAGREFATLDNSDPYANTYQGFSGFFVADARVRWQATNHWSAALGVENLLDRRYFLFHPFPGRTVIVELKYQL
jgi:iron complex outermembrane receptor protein